MEEREYLQNLTGTAWTGVRFCNECSPCERKSTLCEALGCSFGHSFCLRAADIQCPGALRSLGLPGDDAQLAAHIAEETSAEAAHIRSIVAATPRMARPVAAMELGDVPTPELFVGYLQPEDAMNLLRQWQQQTGKRLETTISSFMAVCSALIAALHAAAPVFSLGCPASRKKGGIPPGHLAVILPYLTVTCMMKGSAKCRHMSTSVLPADTGSNSSRT